MKISLSGDDPAIYSEQTCSLEYKFAVLTRIACAPLCACSSVQAPPVLVDPFCAFNSISGTFKIHIF